MQLKNQFGFPESTFQWLFSLYYVKNIQILQITFFAINNILWNENVPWFWFLMEP